MLIRLVALTALLVNLWVVPSRLHAQENLNAEKSVGFEESVEVAPVTLDGVELFRVRGISSYPASRRAKEIRERIVEIAKDNSISPESIVQTPVDGSIQISAGKKYLLRIFEADTKLEGIEIQTYSEIIARVLKGAIQNYREERRSENVRQAIFYSGIATLLFLFVLFPLQWLFRKIAGVIRRKKEHSQRIIKVGSVELIESNRFWGGVASLFGVFRIFVTLGFLYAYLEFVLRQFPWTRFLAARLLKFVLDPLSSMGQSFLDYIPNLIFLFVLATVVMIILKFVRSFFMSIERGAFIISGFEVEWARPTYRILRLMIIAFSLVVAYPYIPGSDSDAFKGVSIFAGVLLSLGSSSAISNIIAGYTLIYRRAFKLGDRIQIGDVTGDVTQIRLQVTHVRTIKNEEITIPNSVILNSHVINYSALARAHGLILHTSVGIGYEVPWRQVEAMLIRAAERTQDLLKNPPPFVLQKALGDFSVVYEINAYCQDSHRLAQIYTELHRNILDEFNEYGVQIMTPAYERDPESPKVVPKDKWFVPPAKL